MGLSRPGQRQGLLYKQRCHLMTDQLSNHLPSMALQRPQAQMVGDGASSHNRLCYTALGESKFGYCGIWLEMAGYCWK